MSIDILRRCRFAPYRKGPRFSLTMWATTRADSRGQTVIGYRLTACGEPGNPDKLGRESCVVFEGEDFSGSPMHADDSDATVASLMAFLTLRLDDTDRDYFAKYTGIQCWFRDSHAEAVQAECMARFGEDS